MSVPLAKVNPDDTRMHLKCVVVTPLLAYLDHECGNAVTQRLIADTGMNYEYLCDDNHWISAQYYFRLLQAVVDETGNRMAPYIACRDFSDRKSWRAVAFFMTHLGSTAAVYRLTVQYNTLWNRISQWRLLEMHRDSCRIAIRFSGAPHDANNCLAIRGSLASAPRLFGFPAATVEMEACGCDGADACIYCIHWQEPPRHKRMRRGLLIGLMLMTGILICNPAGCWLCAAGFVPIVCAMYGRILDYRRQYHVLCKEQTDRAESLQSTLRDIEALNEKLQNTVEERTAELTAANKALQESHDREVRNARLTAMGTLAGGMAHELNTPLNTIQLSAQQVLHFARDEASTAAATRIHSAAARCARIVSDLLTLSRDPDRSVAMSLDRVVQGTAALFNKEHADDRVAVAVTQASGHPLVVDGAQVQQALMNLFNNAADAMNNTGTIHVLVADDAAGTRVEVRDEGPGVPESIRERIFDPFFSTRKRGLGMGLAITAQLVQRNQGAITVHSAPEGGALFRLSFRRADPVQPSRPAAPAAPSLPPLSPALDAPAPAPTTETTPPPVSLATQTIWSQHELDQHHDIMDEPIDMLLVEDDDACALSMQALLQNEGFVVTTRTTVDDALSALGQHTFDLVVSDIRLDRSTGIDLLQRLREQHAQTPIILITGHDSVESAIQAVRLGAQDYIRKPFHDIRDVSNPARRIVYQQRLLRRARRMDEELRKLTRQLLLVEEEERNRLAHDLHDSVGQILADTLIQISILRAANSDERQKAILTRVVDNVTSMIQQIRTLTFELCPRSLDEVGLRAALTGLADKVQQTHGIAVHCQCAATTASDLPKTHALLLFRTARELVHNAIKHASASIIEITVERDDRQLRLQVSDNGRGFQLCNPMTDGDGLGLVAIRERVQALGGKLAIASDAAQGTRVTITLPTLDRFMTLPTTGASEKDVPHASTYR